MAGYFLYGDWTTPLPNINDVWGDYSDCGYAMIARYAGSNDITGYYFCIYPNYPYERRGDTLYSSNYQPDGDNYNESTDYIDSKLRGYYWGLTDELAEWHGPTQTQNGACGSKYYPPTVIWSNHDIYNQDGTLHFAANASEISQIFAETPKITKDLPVFGSATYESGFYAETLSIEASVSDGGTLTYQWFCNGLLIEGATSSEYEPKTDGVGTYVYNCKVTNTIRTGLTAFNYSNSYKIVVVESGSGTGGGGDGGDVEDSVETLKSVFMSGFAAGAALYSGTVVIGSETVALAGNNGGDPSGDFQTAFKSGFFAGLAMYGHAVEQVVIFAEQDGETLTVNGAYAVAQNGRTLEVT